MTKTIKSIIEAGEVYTIDRDGNEVILAMDTAQDVFRLIARKHGSKGGWQKGRPRK